MLVYVKELGQKNNNIFTTTLDDLYQNNFVYKQLSIKTITSPAQINNNIYKKNADLELGSKHHNNS